MIIKAVKIGVITVVGVGLLGGFLFGTDAVSYVTSSARSVKTAVKDAVPIEFELRRARDLLDDIIPEMQANVRLIAREEIEVEGLKVEIAETEKATEKERVRLVKLRQTLASDQPMYIFASRRYSHVQVKEELARQFDRCKEAKLVLAGKHRLLDSREKSLNAAMQMLDKTRSQKIRLEDQIEALDAQHRLVKAAAVGSRVQIDNSKLAKTEKLIRDIKKRLDVAERVLAHDSRFVDPIPVDTINEQELLARVDEHLGKNRSEQRDSLALSGPCETR